MQRKNNYFDYDFLSDVDESAKFKSKSNGFESESRGPSPRTSPMPDLNATSLDCLGYTLHSVDCWPENTSC